MALSIWQICKLNKSMHHAINAVYLPAHNFRHHDLPRLQPTKRAQHHVDRHLDSPSRHRPHPARASRQEVPYDTPMMPPKPQEVNRDVQDQAIACEGTLSFTEDFSRPASLARAAQPSALTGLVSRTATAPIDRLKFILQVQDGQLITVRQVFDRFWHMCAIRGMLLPLHCTLIRFKISTIRCHH